MKSLLKNVRILSFEDLLKINGGYSGSSGGGSGSGNSSSRSSGSSRSSSSSSSYSSGYSGCSGGGSKSYSRSSSKTTSAYSAASGGTGKNSGAKVEVSAYCGVSGGWNEARVTLFGDGTGYSSLTGFFDGRTAYNSLSSDWNGSGGEKSGGNDVVDPTKSNQRDFSPDTLLDCGVADKFGDTACAATSLLNEVSEIYTRETGRVVSAKEMNSAMKSAVNKGVISNKDATVNDWVGAANVMAKSMGLSGKFTWDGQVIGKDITIYGLEKHESGKVSHFVSSVGNDKYYDPWSGTTGNISDFAKNNWGVQYRGLTYHKK